MADKKNISNRVPLIKKYMDLFYMTPSEVFAKELAGLLASSKELQVELWEEMNVLEVELPNGNTVDFEPVETRFKDPSDASFIKNRHIRTIFAICIMDKDLELVKALFTPIIDRYSGFLCADSEDFRPVYAGSSDIIAQ